MSNTFTPDHAWVPFRVPGRHVMLGTIASDLAADCYASFCVEPTLFSDPWVLVGRIPDEATHRRYLSWSIGLRCRGGGIPMNFAQVPFRSGGLASTYVWVASALSNAHVLFVCSAAWRVS